MDIKIKYGLEDSDPLGRPVWSNKGVRRPSIDDEGHECNPGDTGKWQIINDKNLFQIKIETFKYEPEDISVNRDPKNIHDIVVVGKKTDKRTRETIPGTVFERRFSLPEDVDYNSLNKIYASSGVLVIEAQKSGRKI